MTQEEFEFWQRAYLAGLGSVSQVTGSIAADSDCNRAANLAVDSYRIAKATVVQTTYATRD